MEEQLNEMNRNLKLKKNKMDIVSLTMAEQMQRHQSSSDEKLESMSRILEDARESLVRRQGQLETRVEEGLGEMDKDVQEGFARVEDYLSRLEEEMGAKTKLVEEKVKSICWNTQSVVTKEGQAWRRQIREISLINEMHQHVILQSFQDSHFAVDNLEKGMAELSQELADNFGRLDQQVREHVAMSNTEQLMAKVQLNLRFEAVGREYEGLKRENKKTVRGLERRMDQKTKEVMQVMDPVRMQLKQTGFRQMEIKKQLEAEVDTRKGEVTGVRESISKLEEEADKVGLFPIL